MGKILSKKISLTNSANRSKVSGENSNKQNNRKLEFIINNYRIFIALICLLLMVGSFLFFFLPQYRLVLAESNNNNKLAQAELNEKQKYQANLIKLNDFYKNINQKTRDKVMDILPTSLDKENLLAEIEAICLINSLLIKSSDIVSSVDDSMAETIKADSAGQLRSAVIKLELKGQDYNSFKGLLKTIENNLHLMDIEKLSYLPSKNQIIMDIKIYYLAN